MSQVFYVQECPTCGRRLEVRVEHLGRKLVCQHCGGEFIAREGPPQESNELMLRAERLLTESAIRRAAE
ncbi:MAG: hypothetical protein HYS13_12805 [Planctomycetia bacterium]|nr:hypothetical protein [Planctomycetia bacterium]